MNHIQSVSVYCASSSKLAPRYVAAAQQLGTLLADQQIEVINGAGNIGLMCAVSDAALAAGGTVTGIIPQFMIDQGWHHTALTQLIVTNTMHERKQLMAERSNAVIALPGGCGTFEELLEVITWKQLGIYLHPIVILNIDGFYDPLLDLFARCVEQQFMRPEHAAIWHVATTPEEAVSLIQSLPRWEKEIRKFAAV